MKSLHEHTFFMLLSQYSTVAVIEKFAKLNHQVYKSFKEVNSAVLSIDITDMGLPTRSKNILLTHWILRDIILYKLKKGSVNKPYLKQSMTDREAFKIILFFNDYENSLSKLVFKKTPPYYSLVAYGEQQFKGQVNTYEHYWKRNNIIFNILDSENIFDLDQVIRETFEMTYDEFSFIMFMLIATPLINNVIELKSIAENYFHKVQIENFSEKYHRVIDYYTITNETISNLDIHQAGQQYLFAEDSDQNFIIDCFMIQEKLADSFIWIARDYYLKNIDKFGKNYFPNKFGILFERYIEYIVKQTGQYHRLFNINDKDVQSTLFSKSTGKKIDFVIETDKYSLIIEVKSGIKPLAAKDVFNNYEAINNYFKKTFEEGAEQILSVFPYFKNKSKIMIGLIVTYEETYNMTHAKIHYLASVNKSQLSEVLLFSIHEFELLLDMLGKSSFDVLFYKYLDFLTKGNYWDFNVFIGNEEKFESYLDSLSTPKFKDFEDFFIAK